MALKDWMWRFTRRWNARHSRYYYDGRRGVYEVDDGLPAGHSGKLTALVDPTGILAPPLLNLPNPTDIGYITEAEFAWVLAGPPEQLALQDAIAGNILASTEQVLTQRNEVIGDGSSVIAQFTGGVVPVVSHGGPPPLGGLIKITYYIKPAV